MKHQIYFYREKKNLGYPNAFRHVKKAIIAALENEKMNRPCEVSVTFTDDEGICAINREQRNIDSPTDVLSFPMGEDNLDTNCLFLGDMIISLERCAAQGEEYGGGFAHEVQYLSAHSLLHLLGYDHVDEAEQKAEMRAHEKEIMKRLGYDY